MFVRMISQVSYKASLIQNFKAQGTNDIQIELVGNQFVTETYPSSAERDLALADLRAKLDDTEISYSV